MNLCMRQMWRDSSFAIRWKAVSLWSVSPEERKGKAVTVKGGPAAALFLPPLRIMLCSRQLLWKNEIRLGEMVLNGHPTRNSQSETRIFLELRPQDHRRHDLTLFFFSLEFPAVLKAPWPSDASAVPYNLCSAVPCKCYKNRYVIKAQVVIMYQAYSRNLIPAELFLLGCYIISHVKKLSGRSWLAF